MIWLPSLSMSIVAPSDSVVAHGGQGEARVINILTRGQELGLADEDEIVRLHAAMVLVSIAERGDQMVVAALLNRVWREKAKHGRADPWLDEDPSPVCFKNF